MLQKTLVLVVSKHNALEKGSCHVLKFYLSGFSHPTFQAAATPMSSLKLRLSAGNFALFGR